MYVADDHIYCYRGSKVLKNRAGLTDQSELDEFELAMVTQRFDEALPVGRLSVSHYRAVHSHLFQDVYSWAGNFRKVRISKGESVFCYPENIALQMFGLFAGLKKADYLRRMPIEQFCQLAAEFLSDLNAIHPFRDGNGRSQLAFLALLSDRAGYSLDLLRLDNKKFLNAMILSFKGKTDSLAHEINKILWYENSA